MLKGGYISHMWKIVSIHGVCVKTDIDPKIYDKIYGDLLQLSLLMYKAIYWFQPTLYT